MAQTITLPTSTGRDGAADLPSPGWVARFIDEIPTALAVFDGELRYVAANRAWITIFRLAADRLPGRQHHEVDPVDGPQLLQLQQRVLRGETVEGCGVAVAETTSPLRRRVIHCRPRLTEDGKIVGVIAALHEGVVAVLPRAVDDGPDQLTGVAGRDAFLCRLRTALPGSGSGRRGSAVFLLDIEDFKGINGLYGTRIGDDVLKSIATRLLTGVRSRPTPAKRSDRVGALDGPDLVARLGADEFGVILGSAAPTLADAEAFARRLLQLVLSPVVVDEQRIRLTANVGYLITSPAHQTEDDVLRDLNVALHEAKARGPNSAKASDPALTNSAARRLSLLNELRRALEEGEFVLHYQPIVTLDDQSVVGAEALLRWNHPREGLVPPKDFLPLLEESGLIIPVGCWIIREVVRQMETWRALYGRDLLDWVSINVSARQFNDPSLLLSELRDVAAGGFPLDRLKLEITESAVMRNPDVTRAVLGELKSIGIRVALDDFGTGYSALGALRHYSVDMIKIDRGFTMRLDTHDGKELVLALLKIARIYGAAVVAEGVETQTEHSILCEAGCVFGQGYLFAKPMEGNLFGTFALTHLGAVDAGDAAA